MSRRASRKVDYSETKDSSEDPIISPSKLVRTEKVVKVEEAKSKRKTSGGKEEIIKAKKATAKYTIKEEDSDEEVEAPISEKKANGVKGKPALKPTKVQNTKRTQKTEGVEEEELAGLKSEEITPKIKISSVRGKATIEADKNKKAPAKRKAKKEEDDENEGDDTKTKKKRKTKEEKETEAMPILARTAVAMLKKAMHIGAHVSGAGGKFSQLVLECY